MAGGVFGDVADFGLGGAGAGGAAEYTDGAFGGAEVAGEELEEGGFAGAGGTEETVDFTGAKVEGEVVEGAGAVVVEGEGDVTELGGMGHGRGGGNQKRSFNHGWTRMDTDGQGNWQS